MVTNDRELARLMPAVARLVQGSANKALSSERKWRYGRKGSLVVYLRRGTWYDHEADQGGGVLDLVRVKQNLSSNRAAADWLRAQGILQDDRRVRPDKTHELPAAQRRPAAPVRMRSKVSARSQRRDPGRRAIEVATGLRDLAR